MKTSLSVFPAICENCARTSPDTMKAFSALAQVPCIRAPLARRSWTSLAPTTSAIPQSLG